MTSRLRAPRHAPRPTRPPIPALRPAATTAQRVLLGLILALLACAPGCTTGSGRVATTDTSPPDARDTAADSSDTAVSHDLQGPDTLAADTPPPPDGSQVDTTAETSPDTTDAALAEDDAAIVDFIVEFPAAGPNPTPLPCGTTGQARVVVRNRGSATWTRAAGYKLGAVDDSDPFTTTEPRIWLSDTDRVAPGDSHTFLVPLQAPEAPGSYTTDWQMVREGVHWFGGIARAQLSVACAGLVDATTLEGKVMAGYQGWFACPGDGSLVDGWVHWFRNNSPDAANATFDLWPDTSELDADERCLTDMSTGGAPAVLFSSYNPKTVARHFAWMADYGIDGVFLQRFTSELVDPRFYAFRDQLAANVRAGAEAHGRAFALMIDISGHAEATLVADLEADWQHIVDDLKLTESDRYLHHDGKPVLAIWGLGFSDRPGTPSQAQALIDFFHNAAEPRYRVHLVGGVPTYWRTLDNDAKTDPAWAAIYRSFDTISPWSVGRFRDDAGADAFRRDLIAPDLVATQAASRLYMPVVFPGFSWLNLLGDPLNMIPRRGGAFLWRQAYNAVDAGASVIYVAMFDEVDEGTAIFKAATTQAQVPDQGSFLSLDADGSALPSDWYLQVTGQIARMVRGELATTATLPIQP